MLPARKNLSIIGAFCAIWLSFSPISKADDGETIPVDESGNIQKIVDMITGSVQTGFDKTGHAYRDAHRKTHGCVAAHFEVQPNQELARHANEVFRKSASVTK